MPKVIGSDLVVQSLKNEGVNTVFYLPGGPMSDVARLCIEMQFQSIDVRHEQAAAMMAHAYNRLTGKPGVCSASTGPGVANLVPGVLEARSGCSPGFDAGANPQVDWPSGRSRPFLHADLSH